MGDREYLHLEPLLYTLRQTKGLRKCSEKIYSKVFTKCVHCNQMLPSISDKETINELARTGPKGITSTHKLICAITNTD